MASSCDLSDLCGELGGAVESEFSRTYAGDPSSRILMTRGSLRVLADLSPLTEGHLLVVPVQHYLNFAQFMAARPDELPALTTELTPTYRRLYGDVSYLEHGSSSNMRLSACINHAHLHVLPLRTDEVISMMHRDGLEETLIGDLQGLAKHADDDLPYYLASDTQSAWMFGLGRHMAKQYLRSVAARLLQLEDGTWDWAAYIRRDLCRRTIVKMMSETLGS
jgi:diadenosine tetraphosphate (Ap4A) HIT family hydrolase